MKINIRLTGFILVLMLVLSGCKEDTIVDLIHPETESQTEDIILKKKEYEKYKVGDVLFIPFTNQLPWESYEQEYETYKLELTAYKEENSDSEIVINSVSIEGNKAVKLDTIQKQLDITVEFTEETNHDSVLASRDTIVDVISEENMNLTESSVITVVINVSVKQNENTITRDLSYKFVPRFRTYMVTR
ncbi:hypothetical protein FZW96_21205 [Bacillus sp. BGMRC 2118]|nr:hypothetical protein FZW96_21205 [Bacillus sp. BGMRC 2118]